MNKERTNQENVKIAIRKEELGRLAQSMSGEACWLLVALVAKLKRKDLNIVVSLQDIFEAYPRRIAEIYQGLEELKNRDVIREIKDESGINYLINPQVLPTIFLDC